MVLKGGRKSRHRRTKHKRHHKRKHRRKTKQHRRRHRMRGGSRPGISPKNGSPAAPFNEKWGGPARAFPPGPMYTPGVYNDAKYYGKLDNPFLPDPTNTHGTGVTRKHGKVGGGKRRGGRKSRKGGRKSRKGGRKSRSAGCTGCGCSMGGGSRRRRRGGSRRRRRGGSISQFLSGTLPGFSDFRDVYWKGGEVLKNGYNQWFGFPHVNNTSAGVQPIGKSAKVVRPDVVNVGTNLQTGANAASKYTN